MVPLKHFFFNILQKNCIKVHVSLHISKLTFKYFYLNTFYKRYIIQYTAKIDIETISSIFEMFALLISQQFDDMYNPFIKCMY